MSIHKCEVCGDEFDSERGLHVHQTAVHGGHAEEVEEGGNVMVPNESLTLRHLAVAVVVSVIAGAALGSTMTGVTTESSANNQSETVIETQGGRIWEDSIRREGAPTEGSSGAELDVVLYQDYSCEECRTFAMNSSYLDSIREKYVENGIARLIWKFHPGDNAEDEVLLECVHRHSPESFDLSRRALLGDNQATKKLNSLGVYEQIRIQECRNSRSARQDVRLQKEIGSRLGINTTPGMIVDDTEAESYWYTSGLVSARRYDATISEALRG